MRRAVVVILLALLAIDVSGLSGLCGETSCDEPCPSDNSDGQCPPNCHDCSCCSLPKVTGSAAPALVAPAARAQSWSGPIDRLPSPEPADILHVPKLSRA
ncbi:MAG TPA: hypothetical protein VFN38_09875 [Gemmatimonadaceae bacterium]|nr:hypothetical protein [Gemmatimonadaceae bacterium]